jgi:hypothetical protein
MARLLSGFVGLGVATWKGQRVHKDVWKDPVYDRRQVRLESTTTAREARSIWGRVPRGYWLSAVGDLLRGT